MNYLFIILTIISGYEFKKLTQFDEGEISMLYDILIADTDHDGLGEIILDRPQYTIWEYSPPNQFVKVYEFPRDHISPDTTFDPCAVGDADGDGLADICGIFNIVEWTMMQQGWTGSAVFESKDVHSHPDSFTWVVIESTQANSVELEYLTDLDSDGKMELFGNFNNNREKWEEIIYECRSNDYYVPVWRCSTKAVGTERAGDYVFGDFDGDNKQEFFGVAGGYQDSAYIYECAGNDDYKCTWVDHHVRYNMFDAWLGNDTDQDGKPEIFMKNYWYGPNPAAALTMYEAVGDNAYELVEIDTVRGNIDPLEGRSTCGDVDGDSVDEVILSVGTRVIIYKATGDNKYERVWEWWNEFGDPVNGYTALVACYDFNEDGYEELVISGNDKTAVFEIDKAAIAEIKPTSLNLLQLSVVPKLIRNSAVISYSVPQNCRVELTIYDVAGKAVEKLVNGEVRRGSYFLLWNRTEIPAGIYFIRLEAENSILTDKAIILQ